MKILTQFLVLLLALAAWSIQAEEVPQPDLLQIEAALKVDPNDPMLHYRKCQALFALGQEQASVDHATITLQKFKDANQGLAWMLLGSIETEKHRIDVHYNMGPAERAEERDGIVRPLSFRIWTREPDPEIIRSLDFELAYFEGQIVSAALGEMRANMHANYGILKADSSFDTIKKKVLEVLEN
ncbi:MAG: hypothetical protein ACQKBY_01270 [Verrucomicrobiales bacterium]